VSAPAYVVVEVPPRSCIDCGRSAAFRVADTRKKHGERYPGPLRCKPCARRIAAERNAAAVVSRKVEAT
jgi:hypothetical protein